MKKEKKINLSIIFGSILFLLVGIVTFLLQKLPIYLPTLAVGILGIILFFIKNHFMMEKAKESIKLEKELKELEETQQDLKEEVSHVQKEIEDFLDEYSENDQDLDTIIRLTEIKTKWIKYKDLKNTIDMTLAKQNEVMKKLEQLEESIKNYLLKYFTQITNSYVNYAQEIKMKKNEFMRQKQDYETKLKIKQDYEKENPMQELKSSTSQEELQKFNQQEIEEKINDLSKQINQLNDEKNYNKNQIEVLESNLETVFDIENELQELEQTIQNMEENCKILEKTKKYLETAKEQFSSHYLKGMKESFIRNLKLMNGKEMDVNLDVNLNVEINEQGSNKELRYFSTGYQDLIYICMRLSLIDSLFEKEKPFIILDDPFVNLDENKIKNATHLLRNIAQEYQILYFICHESRK